MKVKRIVGNIAAEQVEPARRFYGEVLGLTVVMDLGWILTFAADCSAAPQLSVAAEGGSGTSVPDLSVEVDNLDEARRRVLDAGFAIEYGPVHEPWGVTRFYTRDPLGRLVNIVAHD